MIILPFFEYVRYVIEETKESTVTANEQALLNTDATAEEKKIAELWRNANGGELKLKRHKNKTIATTTTYTQGNFNGNDFDNTIKECGHQTLHISAIDGKVNDQRRHPHAPRSLR